jgi:hypothetical protein
MNTTNKSAELSGWVKVARIENPPFPECGMSYEQLKERAMESDHGEERLVIEHPDGSGADCYYRGRLQSNGGERGSLMTR